MVDFATPAAEVAIDPALVSALLRDQYPAFAATKIEMFAEGWDNALLRIGDKHLARLPRREFAVPLVRNEQLALPAIAPFLPVPIPAPIFVGAPSAGYPWPWSLVPWIDGLPAAQAALDRRGAIQMAEFWAALHNLDASLMPDGCKPNPWRGVALAARHEAFEDRLQRIAEVGEPLSPELLGIWETAIEAKLSEHPVIVQGDPHARNILTSNGKLAAVIDWGDITRGDAACDLGSFWMLIHDPADRRAAIARYAELASHEDAANDFDALIARSRGWALLYGLMLRVTGLTDHPVHAQMGLVTLINLQRQAS